MKRREEVDTERGVKWTDSYKPEQFQAPCSSAPPSKLPLDRRQRFQPCNPSAVLYVSFSLHWLPLFQTWSDQPGTVYLSYLARRYPCVRTDRAPKISVSFSDTQRDKGCPTHWQNGDLFSRLRWLWIAFGEKSETFTGLTEKFSSSELDNWTAGRLAENAWTSAAVVGVLISLVRLSPVQYLCYWWMMKQADKSSSLFSLLSTGLGNTHWAWKKLTYVISGCVALNDWLRVSPQVWRNRLES